VEFLYTGSATISGKNDHLDEIMKAAKTFECDELDTICKNIINEDEYLNPSIGTWLNDTTGSLSKELFLNKKTLSDISFKVEGKTIYSHKAILASRCAVLATMLSGGFMESKHADIPIPDTTFECFLALIEFLYTDHAPIEKLDAVELMILANRFGMSRLVTLCELYISKDVEVATRVDIIKADIDVIGLLLVSQTHNAPQLAAFCSHFIYSNYQLMIKRPEWKSIEGENRKFMDEHQWPPVSYLKELEIYEKATGGKSDDKQCAIM